MELARKVVRICDKTTGMVQIRWHLSAQWFFFGVVLKTLQNSLQ